MITIKNLTVSYKQNKKVLDQLEVDLHDCNIHGIVGLNGAGKTTLLNTLYGLKSKNSGTISWNGHKLSKRNMAFLPTDNYFYSYITGREYLKLFKNASFYADQWNELFLLPLDKIIDQYSTGMKKKVALMGVLKQDKPLMILDEPFDRLDMETSRNLRSILLKLKEKGKTIIVTSHIIETLTNLCDSIHYLEHGKIRFSKSHEEFGDFEKEITELIEQKNEKTINKLINPTNSLEAEE